MKIRKEAKLDFPWKPNEFNIDILFITKENM